METRDQKPGPNDEQLMAVCAIRYAMGRKSFVVLSAAVWARYYGASHPGVRATIVADLESAFSKIQNGVRGEPLGSEIDVGVWREVLDFLKPMVERDRALVLSISDLGAA
jgi:hypothetical protein